MIKQMFVAPALFGVALLSGQSSSAPPSRASSLDDVVREVRTLRDDLHRMAESSLRAQVLVGRLQVEEQRIDGLARQLAETDEQIRALDAARNPMLSQMLKQFEQASAPSDPGEMDMLAGVRAQLEKIQNGDPILKERRESLARMLTDEEARWVAFNSQLEALERTANASSR